MVCFELVFFMSNSNSISNSKQTTAQKLMKVKEDDYTRRSTKVVRNLRKNKKEQILKLGRGRNGQMR